MINSFLTRRQLAVATAATIMSAKRARGMAQQAPDGWRKITATGSSPEPRWDHILAPHDSGKQLVVFGGRNGNGTALADLWSFSRTRESWTQHQVDGPAARFGHAVATDQDHEVMYVFGGQAADVFYNDLWAFDLTSMTWRLLDDGGGIAPSQRYGTSLALAEAGMLIVSHGFTFEGRFDDTWAFDVATSTWSDLTPAAESDRPLKRCLHEAVWSSSSERMFLYGGCSSGFGPCPQGDLWAFDPTSGEWSELTVDPSPQPRSNPGLAIDNARDQLLLFGGLTEQGFDNQYFSLREDGDSLVSTEIVPAGDVPPARASHDLAITGPHVYLFGGNSESGALNDLWTLDLRALET